MIIRKVTPEEYRRTLEIFSVVFELEGNIEKDNEKLISEVTNNPKNREECYFMERWASFLDDNKTMTGFMITEPFNVNFDGASYKMSGIGGVASLPQYRKLGGIRGCFENALPALYDEGVAFSYLYPFSNEYYRKFGYELGCAGKRYRVKLDTLKPFEVTGTCYLVEPNNYMRDDIKSIYEFNQNKYNMMVINENFEYDWIEKSDPAKRLVFTYVYKSADNTPLAYVTFRTQVEGDMRNIYCERMSIVNAEGIKGILNLFVSLASNHHYATFMLPEDIDIDVLLLERPYNAIVEERIIEGMVRVVNVEKVLMGAKYVGDGELAIEIRDEQVVANNKIFKVSFIDGKAVSVNEGDKADISMSINSFSRLIIGACDVNSLEYMPDVTVHRNIENIGKVFYKKPNMIVTHF